MSHFRIFTLAVLILITCSMTSVAAERYVISAKSGTNLILKIIKVEQNRIRQEDLKIIDTHNYIVNTAVVSRKLTDFGFAFDVYFVTCMDPSDIDCAYPTLSMIRLDSELAARYRKDFKIPVVFTLSAEQFDAPDGFTRRLFIADRDGLSERKLRKDGSPFKESLRVNANGYQLNAIAAEDGKMAALIPTNNEIEILKLHSAGSHQIKHVDDSVYSLALSGEISAKRFLFFRVYRDLESRVMRQKIDEEGKFVGEPKAFTKFDSITYYDFSRSVAVTRNSNIVIYSDYSEGCRRQVLKAQAFDPQTENKVGSPKFLIGCVGIPVNSSEGIGGIAVTQIHPEQSGLNPFAGNWKLTFSGDCPAEGKIKVGTFGGYSGDILSPCEVLGGLHYVSGNLSASGEIQYGIIKEGGTFEVGSMTGTFKETSASGTYQYLYGNQSGKWKATKD